MKLTLEQSFDWYLKTLERCGYYILEFSDKEIEYQIFEELAIDYPAVLSKYTRDRLEENGIINENISQLSKELQDKLLKLNGSSLWNIKDFREAIEWREVLELSDEIKKKIFQKWNDDDIKTLRGN